VVSKTIPPSRRCRSLQKAEVRNDSCFHRPSLPDKNHSEIASRASPCPSDGTDSTDYHPDQHRDLAYKYYQQLIDRGGRPSQPIKPIGPCPPPTYDDMFTRYCDHCANHWDVEINRAMAELEAWTSFFRYRASARKPAKLESYKSYIHKHLRTEGFSWTIELQLERQTKLDEWREYYLYHLSRLRSAERRAGDQSQPPKTPDQRWARCLIEDRLEMFKSASAVLRKMEAELADMRKRGNGKSRGSLRRSERLKNRSPQSLPKLPQRSCRVFKSRKKPSAGSRTPRRWDSLDAYKSAES
jgi:hypothetical protein